MSKSSVRSDLDPQQPLAGKRVVITRAAHQAEPTAQAFAAAGAQVERLPLLEVVPPADDRPLRRALDRLDSYRWLIVSSANTVESIFGRLAPGRQLPERLRIAAIGPSTAAALRSRSVEPDLVAGTSRSEGLLEALGAHLESGDRIVLPQAADARALLYRGLIELGMTVDAVVAYAKQPPADRFERCARIFGREALGWVVFTSPSTARNFAALFDPSIDHRTDAATVAVTTPERTWPARRSSLLAASIGPITSRELRRLGVEPAAEATTPSDGGLVDAVSRALV